MSEGKSCDTLAEEFVDCFLEKIENIRQQFININLFKPMTTDTLRLQILAPLTTNEVKKEISSMKNKSCELDTLQTHISYQRYVTGMPRCNHKNCKFFTHSGIILHGMEDSYSQTLVQESRLWAYKQKL